MYVTDLTDFIDPSGAIGPVKGPAPAMAQFHVDAHASDTTPNALPAKSSFEREEIQVRATHGVCGCEPARKCGCETALLVNEAPTVLAR